MSSGQFQSQTAAILVSLQQKISKYLTPSYETSDIFDKSKALNKDHQKAIQLNKQFIKQNQKQSYQKNQQQSNMPQFDKLMYRRKLCESKLNQMLFDHQVSEMLKEGLLSSKLQQNKISFLPYDDDFLSFSTLKQVKSQNLLPSKKQPNFLSIEKELHKMQKKLQNIQKKVNQSKTSKTKRNKKQVSVTKKSKSVKKTVNLKSSENLGISIDIGSSRKNTNSLKKTASQQILKNSSSFLNRQNSEQIINRHKNYKCQEKVDQTSLNNKLLLEKKKTQSKSGLNQSKLKKIGLSRFNEYSKKNLSKVKNQQRQKITQKPKLDQKNVHRSQNRIKLNLLKTESQQVL